MTENQLASPGTTPKQGVETGTQTDATSDTLRKETGQDRPQLEVNAQDVVMEAVEGVKAHLAKIDEFLVKQQAQITVLQEFSSKVPWADQIGGLTTGKKKGSASSWKANQPVVAISSQASGSSPSSTSPASASGIRDDIAIQDGGFTVVKKKRRRPKPEKPEQPSAP